MLQLLALTGSTGASVIQQAGLPPEETQRIGVYVLAGLVGLLTTGIIACSKELRRDLADKKLRRAQDQQEAARTALNALAKSMQRAA
jgi:hypothetical protein